LFLFINNQNVNNYYYYFYIISKKVLLLCFNLKCNYMNSKQQRKQVIRIAMSAMEINKKRLSKSLGWSYPTTLKKLKSPNTLRVDELEQLCEMINLDPVKFIKPF